MLGEMAAAATSAFCSVLAAGTGEADVKEAFESAAGAVECAKSGMAGAAGLSQTVAVLRNPKAGSCTRGFSNWKPAIPVGRGVAWAFGRCSRALRTRSW